MLPFYTDEEIGELIGVHSQTVRYRTARIKRKLGVKTKREVGRFLFERGRL